MSMRENAKMKKTRAKKMNQNLQSIDPRGNVPTCDRSSHHRKVHQEEGGD